jgi:hypothetical protein
MSLAKCFQCDGFYDHEMPMHPTENRRMTARHIVGLCPRCTKLREPGTPLTDEEMDRIFGELGL